MTILFNQPSRLYNPQTIDTPFSVPSGTKQLKMSMTRESWPVGPVGSMTVNKPDGSLLVATTFEGGDQILHRPDGTSALITTQVVNAYGPGINGVTQDLPVGTYSLSIVILQALNSAVTAERF